MKTVFCLVFSCLILGCNSLPSEIAYHAGQTSNNCGEAARKTFNAMNALEYQNVCYCQGQVGQVGHERSIKLHAWVEYTDDNGEERIVDPYAILKEGVHEYWREDICNWEYQQELIIEEIP